MVQICYLGAETKISQWESIKGNPGKVSRWYVVEKGMKYQGKSQALIKIYVSWSSQYCAKTIKVLALDVIVRDVINVSIM